MRKIRVISAVLSAIILTSCGKNANPAENYAASPGNEAIAPETTDTSFAKASELLTETTDSGNRTNTNKASESEIPPIYTETTSKILYEDENVSLTCGDYIDAMLNCEDFIDTLSIRGTRTFQLSDIDGNGIPELITENFVASLLSGRAAYFSVSNDGKAKILHDSENNIYIEAELPVPCEMNGETVWLSDFSSSSNNGGRTGVCTISIDGDNVQTNVIRKCEYTVNTYDSGEYYWAYEYYWYDEPVSEEEYEDRFEKLLLDMRPSYQPYVFVIETVSAEDMYSVTKALCMVMEDYLDSMSA